MNQILLYILLFNFLGSIISLVGGLILVTRKNISHKATHLMSSFAAGTLLGAVFFDLLPEAVREGENIGFGHDLLFLVVLLGILFFFTLERYLHWFHHHDYEEKEIKGKPIVPLVVIGDAIHNFVDGAAIAATFMVSVPLGILTTFAVAAHEIPQEIGDFGILLHQGLEKKKVVLINILSATFSFLGAILAFMIGKSVDSIAVVLIAFSAGLFLYISLSDLIPEIHHENDEKNSVWETFYLFIGVMTVYLGLYVITSIFGLSH